MKLLLYSIAAFFIVKIYAEIQVCRTYYKEIGVFVCLLSDNKPPRKSAKH